MSRISERNRLVINFSGSGSPAIRSGTSSIVVFDDTKKEPPVTTLCQQAKMAGKNLQIGVEPKYVDVILEGSKPDAVAFNEGHYFGLVFDDLERIFTGHRQQFSC